MVVRRGVVSVGSFLSSVVAGRSRVALRVSNEVRIKVLGPGLSPLGSLAVMTLVRWMWSVQSSLDWRFIVMRLCQLCSPCSHSGARCLSNFLEYCTGLHCCRAILSCSFVPNWPCSVVRLSWRVLSTAFDDSLMLVATSFSLWRDGNRSDSSPGMALASLSMRSVGSLRGLD